MPTRAQVTDEALSWLDTPWRHQGRVKGVGIDCLGLLVKVGRAVGLAVADRTDYARQPTRGELYAALNAHLVELDDPARARPGDVLVFDFREVPGEAHVAIVLDATTFVHAYAPVGKVAHGVMTPKWRHCLSSAFSIPGIVD